MSKEFNITNNPIRIAKKAGLIYSTDSDPGYTRKKAGNSFKYFDLQGKVITNKKIIKRINSLGIPPAYKNVWICTNENGHLQATARDAKGRKQYRYHQLWRSIRDETKYDRMISFGKALPKIRNRVRRDLNLDGLPRDKILATVISLLEKTLIRVGNDEYAKKNNSYGLTTLRDKHVEIKGQKITFEFKGKSGVEHSINLDDPRLSKIIKKSKDLPGYELFQYLDENGQKHSISSTDVNNYLKEITGKNFTAKDFRTWYGTVLAAEALKGFHEFDSEVQAKKNIVQAIESVSKQLGNTRTICKKCYIHPAIMDSYMEGSLIDSLQSSIKELMDTSLRKLKPEEAAVVCFLQNKLQEKHL